MSGTPTEPAGRVVIDAAWTVDADTAEALWGLYRRAIGSLETHAAARQLLGRDEFALEVLDLRVCKYLARTPSGQIAGFCTLSADLDTVPWISPEFYRTSYPAHFARRAVFYCGLAVVAPDARSSRAFPEMMAALGRDIAAADGILAADMCRFNVEGTQLARAVTMLMRRAWGSARQVELDRQLYLAWEPGLAS